MKTMFLKRLTEMFEEMKRVGQVVVGTHAWDVPVCLIEESKRAKNKKSGSHLDRTSRQSECPSFITWEADTSPSSPLFFFCGCECGASAN